MYSQLSKYNTIFRGQSGSPFPTAGLQAIVYFNSTYVDGATTYVRTSKGIGLPVISGTGLDRIIDFSPLNDVRFDKGSYVGNAYGLPATYNYPYVGIYYDATSEATRYYWKPTDFAYAVILAQSLLVDNMFFLKATATTDTSNVIASVDRLFIYSVALTGTNLSKMKTYIGIQDDFWGQQILLDPEFENPIVWDIKYNASLENGLLHTDGGVVYSGVTTKDRSSISPGNTYLCEVEIESIITENGTVFLYIDRAIVSGLAIIADKIGVTSVEWVANEIGGYGYVVIYGYNTEAYIKRASVKKKYQNYYKS